jgi:hypothetical protein
MVPRSSARASQRVSYREPESDDGESVQDDSFSESEVEAPSRPRPTRLKRKRSEGLQSPPKRPSTRGVTRVASYAEAFSEDEDSNFFSDEDGASFEDATTARNPKRQQITPKKKSIVSPRKRRPTRPRSIPPPSRPAKSKSQAYSGRHG